MLHDCPVKMVRPPVLFSWLSSFKKSWVVKGRTALLCPLLVHIRSEALLLGLQLIAWSSLLWLASCVKVKQV